jgi:hypothetical protein
MRSLVLKWVVVMACQRSIQTVVGECTPLAPAVKWAIESSGWPTSGARGRQDGVTMPAEDFRDSR